MHATPSLPFWIMLIFLPVFFGCAASQDAYKNVWNGNSGFGHPQSPVRTDL